jgi:hypothetical protein
MKLLQYGDITHVVEIAEWKPGSSSILVKNEQFLPGHLPFDNFPGKVCAHYTHQHIVLLSDNYPWSFGFWGE